MMKLVLVSVVLVVIFFVFSSSVMGQEFAFQTYISSDVYSTQECTFGLKNQALPGLDDFDIPSPPSSPDNMLHAHLVMMTPPASLPNQWLADFRPTQNLTDGISEFWILELTHDLPGATATIFIDQLITSPTPFELWLHQPDSTTLQITIPGTIEISLDSSTLIFFWELRQENPVERNHSTWGGVKSLYR